MLQIRDSVHGYIPVEPFYADIVNTPAFQRLRSVEQGSFRPVFPGARHDRFIHSLGTFHLATKFVDHFFENLEDDENITLEPDDRAMLRETFRYAALLHDVGHAPFSHTTEDLFKEPRGISDPNVPLIWEQLCGEVQAVASHSDYLRFRDSTPGEKGAAHEIVSAILLIRDRNRFCPPRWQAKVRLDLELAARMVIGYLYSESDVLPAALTPAQVQMEGVKNCLIQLLNSKIMDVDRMDYLVRDTEMSGFVNAPVDLDCLAASVTAVRGADGWLVPAFRDSAINVIDTMFHAKLSHDAWVLAHPAGAYDAALRAHCIRLLDAATPGYIRTVFSVDALGDTGVTLGGRHYRYLSDPDIIADLKARNCDPFNELLTRELGKRRTAAWYSYYEFRHLFDGLAPDLTADDVSKFFEPLLDYMDENHLFEFNKTNCDIITGAAPLPAGMKPAGAGAVRAAGFLKSYLQTLPLGPDELDGNSVVLLKRANNLTMKIDPSEVRIRFTRKAMPPRRNGENFSTFAQLRQISKKDNRANTYFYLYRRGGLGVKQLTALRDALGQAL